MIDQECQVCRTTSLIPSSQIRDANGKKVSLLHCQTCDAVQPQYPDIGKRAQESETAWQGSYHESLWTAMSTESVDDVVADLQSMVKAFSETLGPPDSAKWILEVGSGRGALIRALLNEGYSVQGCEPASGLIQQARAALSLTEENLKHQDALTFLDNAKLLKEPITTIFIWHVLEHLEQPLKVIKDAYSLLAEGASILAQVPMLTPDYIFPAHLYFPSSATFDWLADQLDHAHCETWHDNTNLYLTAKITKGRASDNLVRTKSESYAIFTEALDAQYANKVEQGEQIALLQKRSDALDILKSRTEPSVGRNNYTPEPSHALSKISDLDEVIHMMEQKINNLMKSLSEAISTAGTHATQLTEAKLIIDDLAIQNKTLECSNETLAQQLQNTNIQLAETTKSKLQLEIQVERHSRQVELMADQISRLIEEKSASDQQLDLAKQDINATQKRLHATEAIQAITRNALERERDLNRLLSESVHQSERQHHENEREIIALTLQTEELQRLLSEHLENIDAHEGQLAYKFAKKLKVIKSLPRPESTSTAETTIQRHQQSPRSLIFKDRSHNRYWWHRTGQTNYIPLLYSHLKATEWALLEAWFSDTEKKFTSTGEANIPPLSLLMGLISGNGISRIVQCGHYVGYSSLILGFLLRHQNAEKCLFSIDIDPMVTDYTQQWIDRAGLCDQIKLHVGDSADTNSAGAAIEYLGGAPQIVFIDSSHQYEHTLKELDIWYELLADGGFIFLHDTSIFAATFDSSGNGGVLKACREWCSNKGVAPLYINSFIEGGTPGDVPYLDGCGITIIQKTPQK